MRRKTSLVLIELFSHLRRAERNITLGLAAALIYQSLILASYMSGSSSSVSHFMAGYWRRKPVLDPKYCQERLGSLS